MNAIDFEHQFLDLIKEKSLQSEQLTPLISSTYYLNSQGNTKTPCNVEFINPHQCKVSLDVSGYSDASLDIEFGVRSISVRGKPANDKESTLLYRGIADTAFECIFYLADYVEVADVHKVDGLLVLHLIRDHSSTVDSKTVPNQGGSKNTCDHLQHIEVKLAA